MKFSKKRCNKLWQFVAGILGISAILVAWEFYRYFSDQLFVSSGEVFSTLISVLSGQDIWGHAANSVSRVFIGWSLAVIVASAIAIIIYLTPRIRNFFELPVRLIGTIPPIAWTPLGLMWFGIGNPTAYFVVFLGCFFPIFIAALSALNSIENHHLDIASIFGAGSTLKLRTVIIPSILPRYFVGLRTGMTVGWFNVIAAELVGVSSGLGYQLQINRVLLFTDKVIVIMIIIGLLGWVMAEFLDVVETVCIPWAEKETFTHKAWLKVKMNLRFSNKAWNPKRPTDSDHVISGNNLHSELLNLSDLGIAFEREQSGALSVVKNISLSLPPNRTLSVIGPNGCGKSSLLRVIAGLNLDYEGKVLFEQKSITGTSPDRNMVFQTKSLFPWMTVRENLEFASQASQKPATKSVADILRQWNMLGFENYYPHKLSGGMQQKLSVARSLIISPKLLLLDEPFTAYDATSRIFIREEIREMIRELGTSVLLVTHDIDEAIFMGDRVLIMDQRGSTDHQFFDIDLSANRSFEIMYTPEFLSLKSVIMGVLNEKVRNTLE